MGRRRKSRELALQALFYMDAIAGGFEEKLSLFVRNYAPPKSSLPFFHDLVRGVESARAQIDAVINRFSSNWKISRMAGVDRNVLRIAVYEMLCRGDIPVKVSINEAIDIGKKYGSEESGAFINGILDSIHLALQTENLGITFPDAVSKTAAPADAASEDPENSAAHEPVVQPIVKSKSGVAKKRRTAVNS